MPDNGSPWIVDVTEATFETAVLERSKSVPVVLDFHAAWCEPCRTLGPILEDLAREYDGAFVLARVDVDREPLIAQEIGVQSIPFVLAVRNLRQAGHFAGAPKPAEVRRFIEKLCPGGKPVERPAAAAADPKSRELELRERLAKEPGDAVAALELGRMLFQTDERKEARERLSIVEEGEPGHREARGMLAILDLRDAAGDESLEALEAAAEAGGDLPARRLLGERLAASGHYGEALEALYGVLAEDRSFGDGAVKDVMVAIFGVLGPESDLADDYRSRLARLLY